MGVGTHWRFFHQYLCAPDRVGAVAPSSRALAAALCEPFQGCTRPARVLEVGAGTGAITRHLGLLLGDKDELDICERQPDFADILERNVLTQPAFSPGVRQGRINLLRGPVQEIDATNPYDFIISGLPLTVFDLKEVQDILGVIRRCLKPNGVLSYFEYVGLRRTSQALALGRRRKRLMAVSAYLSDHIRNYQFKRQTVLQNFPPAYARHLRFAS